MSSPRHPWSRLGAVPRRSIFGGALAAAGYAAGFGTEAALAAGSVPIVSPGRVTAIAGASVNVLSPSGDISGAADHAAITRLLEAGPSSVVYLAGGYFHVNQPVTVQHPRQAIVGQGANVSAIVAAPGFSGPAIITGSSAAAASSTYGLDDITVANLGLIGGHHMGRAGAVDSFTGNPSVNGIAIAGCLNSTIENVTFRGVNGWCIESSPYDAFPNIGLMMRGIKGVANAGGIHCWSTKAAGWNGQQFLTDIQLQSTGSDSDLDVLLFEDIYDIVAENVNTSISHMSTGSSLHIKGGVAGCLISNFDIGCYPHLPPRTGQSVILIEDGSHGFPNDVHFANGTCQQAETGLTVSGGATIVTFTNVQFQLSYGSNAVVSGSGAGIDFNGCYFTTGGQRATGTTYDLDWSGSATGSVSNCRFGSPIALDGGGGVRSAVRVGSPRQSIPFRDCDFLGSGSDPTRCFSGSPSIVRGCTGFNPVGSVPVDVPASGSPAGPLAFDAWFYITAGDRDATAEVSGGRGATRVPIAARSTVPVFVPASQTITPVYSDAPTWSVYGN